MKRGILRASKPYIIGREIFRGITINGECVMKKKYITPKYITLFCCFLLIVGIGCAWMLSARQVTCTKETVIWQVEPYSVIDTPKLTTAQPNESYTYEGKFVDIHGGEWYKISGVKVGTSEVSREGYISAEDSKISFFAK
jgi:hypothetical protein